MAYKKITKETENKIIELHQQGFSYRDIGQKTGLHKSTIGDVLKRNDIKTDQGDNNDEIQAMRKQLSTQSAREIVKRNSLFNVIGDVLAEAVRETKPPRPPTKTRPVKAGCKNNPEDMVLLISDCQIGESYGIEETGGICEYGISIFEERLEFLKKSLEKIINIHLQNTPCQNYRVFLLGDIIDGAQIHKGQQRVLEIHAAKQVVYAANKLIEFFMWLADITNWDIKIYGVVGNHGRLGKKGEEAPTNNLEYILYHYIKDMLTEWGNIIVQPSETWFQLIQIGKNRIYGVHGDDFRSWMGIPFYGAMRSESRTERLVGYFDYFCVGHHHQEAVFDKVIMNGCWPGGSEYSARGMQVATIPSQKLFAVHPERGKTWERSVYLVDPKTPKNIKIYD